MHCQSRCFCYCGIAIGIRDHAPVLIAVPVACAFHLQACSGTVTAVLPALSLIVLPLVGQTIARRFHGKDDCLPDYRTLALRLLDDFQGGDTGCDPGELAAVLLHDFRSPGWVVAGIVYGGHHACKSFIVQDFGSIAQEGDFRQAGTALEGLLHHLHRRGDLDGTQTGAVTEGFHPQIDQALG